MTQKRIYTFGEIMLRISPYHTGERIAQAETFRIEPGGSESNVAISLANLGHKVSFISKIGNGAAKAMILRYLRKYNVDTSNVIIGGKRTGVYWTENGIGIRASNVLYDREDSAFSVPGVREFAWEKINKDACWFHVSGVTPAISEIACKNTLSALDLLGADVKISVDLNYRSKLWNWAGRNRANEMKDKMGKICSKAYLITANETDFQEIFGYSGADTYGKIAEEFFAANKSLRFIAVSLRTSHSASDNDWSGILFARTGNKVSYFTGPKFKLTNIVDRIGTGDSFTGGIIHGLLTFKGDLQRSIDFAAALSALNHTVIGDASQFEEGDVDQVLAGRGMGRILR